MADAKQKRAVIFSTAAVLVVVASVVVVSGISRARRMARIETAIVLSLEPGDNLGEIVETAINSTDSDLPLEREGEIRVFRINPEEISRDWDLIMSPADFATPEESYVVVDPFIIIADRNAGISPAKNAGATIDQFSTWLRNIDSEVWTPLVVAGDEKRDFAAFIIYLAGEILDEQPFSRFVAYLASDATESNEENKSYIGALEPVIEIIQDWKTSGVLAYNWTDWDRLALQQRLRDGRAAATFALRSELKRLSWDERFDLSIQRPPSGTARRSYRLTGRAVALLPGNGPRSDAYTPLLEQLRSGELQLRFEEESIWSPVILGGPPVNREHRDIIRWYNGASDYLSVYPSIHDHPLFENLHFLLR